MKVFVKDIVADLGCCEVTVRRWINSGELKAKKYKGGSGWSKWIIDERDYEKFLEEHPNLRLIHNGEKYGKKVRSTREDLCNAITTKINTMKHAFKTEEHGKVYTDGFNDAVTRIEQIINKEWGRRFVENEVV